VRLFIRQSREMRHRDKSEIIASILSLLKDKEGMGFTRIMFSSYLSYRQVSRFLGLAISNELLFYDTQTKLYKVTQKGADFLELYTKMENLLRPEQKSIISSAVFLLLYLFYPLFPFLAEFF
jgi:predicted transcriptional regulator